MSEALRILFVSPHFPLPATRGDELVIWHRLRTLGPRHRIMFVAGYDDALEPDALRRVEELTASVRTVRVPRLSARLRMAALAPVSRDPFGVLHYRSRRLARAVRELLATETFDVVHAFTLGVAQHVAAAPCARVLEPIDSLRPMLESAIPRLPRRSRWLFEAELGRVTAYEPAIAAAFDRLIVVSDRDREYFGPAATSVIPNGVDVERFAPFGDNEDRTVVFSGNMSYAPNAQAVQWFVSECWPRVRREVAGATFRVVGTAPGRGVRALDGTDGIEVTGYVPSLAGELSRSTVAVAPMQSGSGIQNKVLEAMACALPVVATRRGLGPITARPGDEVLVADSGDDFAAAVVALLRSPAQRARLGGRAREFVVRAHSWEHGADEVEEVYRRVLERRRAE